MTPEQTERVWSIVLTFSLGFATVMFVVGMEYVR